MIYNSQVILCKNIKIDRSYKNVLTYSESQMLALCQANQVYSNSTYEFLKQDESPMYVNCNYNVAIQCNYMAFQNPNYSNKWFFAFIDSVEYNSTDSVMIHFTIDVFATWFDYWSKLPCYVIREHVNDDTFGLHTIDEGLAVPDVEQNNVWNTNFIDSDVYVVMSSNWDPYLHGQSGENGSYHGVSAYNKNVSGQKYFLFSLDSEGLRNLEHMIWIINFDGHIDDIHDMFIVPQILFDGSGNTQTRTINRTIGILNERYVECTYKEILYSSPNYDNAMFRNIEIEKSDATSFLYYQPKNNKCRCYPFNYLMATNNIGSQNIYKIEDFGPVVGFEPSKIVFQIQLAFAIGCSGRLVPVSYKNKNFNYDESLTLGKFPTCSWSADSFTNWLTNQAVNIGQRVVNIGANIGMTLATGNVVGAISSVSQIASLYGDFKKAQLLPEITGGQSTGDVNFANGNNNFEIIQYTLKPEYMAQIDDYFSRFGYKILRVKQPNITGRQNWNYVQIGSDEIIGASNNHGAIPVPTTDMEKINDIFRSGVTCWHSHDNMGNFGLNNPIM